MAFEELETHTAKNSPTMATISYCHATEKSKRAGKKPRLSKQARLPDIRPGRLSEKGDTGCCRARPGGDGRESSASMRPGWPSKPIPGPLSFSPQGPSSNARRALNR